MDVKKVLLVLCALVTVFSGVAMVSAYEAHVINVTAHVENAMRLQGVGIGPDYEHDFGTVFPEEWMLKTFFVRVSDSFCEATQTTRLNIDYEVWVEEKEGYEWLGDALYFTVNWDFTAGEPKAADMTPVGPTMPTPSAPAIYVLTDSLHKIDNILDGVTMALDVPVFDGYYNENTDVDTKPSGKNVPTVIIMEGESRYPTDMSLGVELGADVKIQVTRIY